MRNGEKMFDKIKWGLYSLKIAIFKPSNKQKTTTTMTAKKKEKIFIFLFLLFPMVQFLIFYVALNFNSILLAFQEYDQTAQVYRIIGFKNFLDVFSDIFVTKKLVPAIKNSAIQSFFALIIRLPLNVITAYVVFKKVPFSGFLKVMLFMPNLISSMAFVINARVLLANGMNQLFGYSLIDPLDMRGFWSVLLFGEWMGFAGGLIVYLSAMASIPKEILEYGELEPLSTFKELTQVVVPLIFPTIVTYVVVGIANFFINAGYFFSFYSGGANKETLYDTLGYYFFVKVAAPDATPAHYNYAAAGGILFTLIVAPATLVTKWALEKYGPSED